MNLSNAIKITQVKAASAAGTTAVNSDVVDMQGYEGVLFMTTIATNAAGNFINAQQGAEPDVSDASDLEDSKIVATAANETVWLDVYRPQERYVRVNATRGTSTALGPIYAVLYEGRKQPEINNVTDTIIGKLLISPEEGTA